MSEWVDLQLAHQMTAVKAPDELWARVQIGGRPARARRVVPRLALGVAALVAVIAVAYSSTKPRGVPQTSSFSTGTCTACHTM